MQSNPLYGVHRRVAGSGYPRPATRQNYLAEIPVQVSDMHGKALSTATYNGKAEPRVVSVVVHMYQICLAHVDGISRCSGRVIAIPSAERRREYDSPPGRRCCREGETSAKMMRLAGRRD